MASAQGLPVLRVCPQESRDQVDTQQVKRKSAKATEAQKLDSGPLPIMGLNRGL